MQQELKYSEITAVVARLGAIVETLAESMATLDSSADELWRQRAANAKVLTENAQRLQPLQAQIQDLETMLERVPTLELVQALARRMDNLEAQGNLQQAAELIAQAIANLNPGREDC